MNNQFLDTNCLARLILKDNLDQYQTIFDLIIEAKKESFKLHINIQVLIELIYVLSRIYSIEKTEIIESIENILNSTTIECQDFEIVFLAINLWNQNNLSIEDCYYISYCLSKNLQFFSFDSKAVKLFQSLVAQNN